MDDIKLPTSRDPAWTTPHIDYLRTLFKTGKMVVHGNDEIMSVARHIDDHMLNHVC